MNRVCTGLQPFNQKKLLNQEPKAFGNAMNRKNPKLICDFSRSIFKFDPNCYMHYEIILLFFLVAAVYSSVGFGGGSSYLAILALFGVEFELLRITALLCNIIVVTGGTFLYWKNGFLNLKSVLPLVLVSVPAAFLGGTVKLSQTKFFILLGIVLIVVAVMMWIMTTEFKSVQDQENSGHFAKNTLIGGGIGFLSGIVGIGGGIFLSPVLHFLNWNTAKFIGAAASFFILVNSIAGLFGQLLMLETAGLNFKLVILLIFAVFLGGQIGSRLGINKLSPLLVKRITAILVLIVGIRILIKYTLYIWM